VSDHATVGSAIMDQELTVRLQKRSAADPAFWDFSQLRERSGSHGLFQYPAMMVPELQGALLDDVVATDPEARSVYDPFSGSGTVLVESLTRGLSFVGGDVNPMAILLSSVKAEPPKQNDAVHAYKEVLRRAHETSIAAPPNFFGRDKWFTQPVASELAKLRLAIRKVDSRATRRFLWVCLAETVRLTSNSRISTFKLHLYPQAILEDRQVSALECFETVAKRNVRGLSDYWRRVDEAGIPLGQATLLQGPVQTTWSPTLDAPDVLMTSPPYGDNKTTVPYGQHSYLPLQWVDGDDIEGGIPDGLISSTAAIDSASLGGSNRAVLERRDALLAYSPSLLSFLEILGDRRDLLKKVISFTGDYYDSLAAITSRLRSNSFSFFTLGERRVGGELFPLVAITTELLEAVGHQKVHELNRNLPRRKRMAVANSEGATMAKETVLVTRKGSLND
jgi:hypothetical protein